MGRLSWLRRLAHGATAGVLFSCLRAPLGLDWTQVAVVQGTTRALFRALALLALALALDPARAALRGVPGAGWLAAMAAGFLLHGLVLDLTPASRAGYVLLLLVGTLVLRALARPPARLAPEAAPDAPDPPDAPGRLERAGLVALGLGSAFALETLAHEVRLYTLATRADDAVLGGVFLLLIALGAAAFGPLLAKLGHERTRFAALCALAAAAALAGLVFLGALAADGLHGYLRRFDRIFELARRVDSALGSKLGLAGTPTLDGASIGTLWTSAILGGAALIVPAFVLGAALGATRHPGRLASVLVGAALGLIVLPFVIRARGAPLSFDELGGAGLAWQLVMLGTSIAALALAVVASAEGFAPRWGHALALAVALVPWIRPRLVLWSFSPWSPRRVEPQLTWPTADGLLTVEDARGGSKIVTLDRVRLTPLVEEDEADGRRLTLAWSLLPEERRSAGVRALLVGQITPARARVLRGLGVLELDRTAPWYRAMPAIEELLFANTEAPPGRVVAPAAARDALRRRAYDWVVATPAWGPIVTWKSVEIEIWGSADAPRITDLELPEGTLGVAWLGNDGLAPRGASYQPLILSVERLESPSLGLVRGPAPAARAVAGPLFRVEGRIGPTPWKFLATMPQLRPFLVRRAWAENLACDEAPDLARGLALHQRAQELSSPFEPRAQQIELDEDALRSFSAAMRDPDSLDPLTRELWEAVAWAVTEKRLPEEAVSFLEPLAERFAPWPALDRAVGHALLELLDPEEAQRYLARAREAEPDDVRGLLDSARCAQELGDPGSAVPWLERAARLQPGRSDVERALALALYRAGDPRGRLRIERLLVENPEDRELLEALAGPPAPAPEGQ